MIILVLGMHKSGTSLVAEILHGSGVAMGDLPQEGADYDEGHKFEDARVRAINKALLGFAESYRLAEPGELRLDPATLDAMRALVAERQAAGGDWGFKDPRTVLTYDAWRSLLPPHRLVLVFRRPAEVWRHYRRLGPRGGPHRRARWAWAVLSGWLGYNRRLLAIAGSTPPEDRMVLDYADLMDPGGGGFGRLEAFVGRELADTRRGDRYRNRAGFDAVVLAVDLVRGGAISRVLGDLRLAARGAGAGTQGEI